jgi:GxxExxY protein
MQTSPLDLKHAGLTEKIIGMFYDVYNELGYGFLESTYAEALLVVLQEADLKSREKRRCQCGSVEGK